MKRSLALLIVLAHAASVFAQPGKPAISVTNASLSTVITLYSTCADRTALIAPGLPKASFTFDVPVTLTTNAARLISDQLAAKDIVVVPDGRIFAMIVPKSWEQSVQPLAAQIRSRPISPTNHMIKGGEIVLHNASVAQVMELYAGLAKAKIDPGSPTDFPEVKINFSTFHPISREEAMYALRTLLLWNNVKINFLAPDLIRAEPVSQK
jgi:hypothetical protein